MIGPVIDYTIKRRLYFSLEKYLDHCEVNTVRLQLIRC